MKLSLIYRFFFIFLLMGNINLFYGMNLIKGAKTGVKNANPSRVKATIDKAGNKLKKGATYVIPPQNPPNISNLTKQHSLGSMDITEKKEQNSKLIFNIKQDAQKTKNPSMFIEKTADLNNKLQELQVKKELEIKTDVKRFIEKNSNQLKQLISNKTTPKEKDKIKQNITKKLIPAFNKTLKLNADPITYDAVAKGYNLLNTIEREARKINEQLEQENTNISSPDIIKETRKNIEELVNNTTTMKKLEEKKIEEVAEITFNALNAMVGKTTGEYKTKTSDLVERTEESAESMLEKKDSELLLEDVQQEQIVHQTSNAVENFLAQEPIIKSPESEKIIDEIKKDIPEGEIMPTMLNEVVQTQDPTASLILNEFYNTSVVKNNEKIIEEIKKHDSTLEPILEKDSSIIKTNQEGNFVGAVETDADGKTTVIAKTTEVKPIEMSKPLKNAIEKIAKEIALESVKKEQVRISELLGIESPAEKIKEPEIKIEEVPEESLEEKKKLQEKLEKEGEITYAEAEKFQEDAQKEAKKKQLAQEKEISKKALEETLEDFSKIDNLINETSLESLPPKKITEELGKKVSQRSSLPEPPEFPQTIKTTQGEISTIATKKLTPLPETPIQKTTSSKETGKNILSEPKVSPLETPQTIKQPPTENIGGKKIVQQSIETSGTKKSQDRGASNKLSGAEKRETKELTGKFEQTKKIESSLEKSLGTKISRSENAPESSKQRSDIISKNVPSQKEIAEKNDATFKRLKDENTITLKKLDDIGNIIEIKTKQEIQDPDALKIIQDTTITLQKTLNNLHENINQTAENALQSGKEKTLSFESTFKTTKDAIKNIDQDVTKKIDELSNKNIKQSLESAVDILIEQTKETTKDIENTTQDTLLEIKGQEKLEVVKKHLIEENKQLMHQANKVVNLLEAEIIQEEYTKKEHDKKTEKTEQEKKAEEKIIEKKKKETETIENQNNKKSAFGFLGLLGLVGTMTKKEETEEAPLSEEEKEIKHIKEMIMKEQNPSRISILWSLLKSIISRLFFKKFKLDTTQDKINQEKRLEEMLGTGEKRKTTKKNISKNKSSQKTTSRDLIQPVYDTTQPTYDEYQFTQEITPSVRQPVLDSIKKDTEKKYAERKKNMDERLKNIEEKLGKKINGLIEKKAENNIPFGDTNLKDYAKELGSKTETPSSEITSGRSEFSPSSFSPNYQPSYGGHDTSYDLFDTNQFAGFDNADFDFGTFDFLSDYDTFDFKKESKIILPENKLMPQQGPIETITDSQKFTEETQPGITQSLSKEYVNEKEKSELLKQKSSSTKAPADSFADEEKPTLQKKYYTPYVVPAIVFMAASCAFLYYWFM